MNKELKERWIEALESGKYQKGEDRLRGYVQSEHVFCCLGVLCDISPGVYWTGLVAHYRDDHGSWSLPEALSLTLEITIGQESKLAELNDENPDWQPVIAYIKEHL